MKKVILTVFASLLVACGGDSEDKNVYLTDPHDGQTELKVFIQGYAGSATVSVDGEDHAVVGDAVISLGYYAEGTRVDLSLRDYDASYDCAYSDHSVLLLNNAHTALFYCHLDSIEVRPYISSYSYPTVIRRLNAPIEVRLATETRGTGDLLGYSIDVVSTPAGGTLTYLSEFSASSSQLVSVDVYGEYFIDVYAYTEGASSLPLRIRLYAEDEPPALYGLKFESSDLNTLTDAVASVDVRDNDPSEVTLSYVWAINGTEVEGVDGDTLPSSLFVKGDVISVHAVAVDLGGNTATSGAISTMVLDALATINLDNIPTSIERGSALSVPIQITDPDNDAVDTVSLVYGPPGMAVQSGDLVWHGDPILMAETGTFHFGLAHALTPDTLFEGSIEVNAATPKIHTISGVGFNTSSLSKVGRTYDFDGNGTLDTLVNDTSSVAIYELGDSVSQSWAYGARTSESFYSSLRDVMFVPQPSGNALVAYLTNRIALVDPVTGHEEAGTELPVNSTSSGSVTYVRDGSGGGMVVTLSGGPGGSSSNVWLHGLDRVSLDVNWQSLSGSLGLIAVVANLDDDPQDEIVTTKGYVFDGLSGENQWVMPSNLSSTFTTLYVESLGRNLLVRSGNTTDTFIVVDVQGKTLSSHSTNGVSNPRLYSRNADGDADDELIMERSGSYTIMDYSVATNTFSATTSYSLLYASNVYEINDLDGESRILATLASNTLKTHIPSVSADWEESDVESCGLLVLASSVQDTLADSITFASRCRGAAYPASLVNVDVIDHQASITALMKSTEVYHAAYGFIDADSNPDIAFSNYSSLYLYDASLNAEIWQVDHGENVTQLDTLDVNDDGAAEIIVTLGDVINIYNHVDQNIVYQVPVTSTSTSGYYNKNVLQFEIYTDPVAEQNYLVAATQKDVRVFLLNDDSLSFQGSVEISDVKGFSLADLHGDGVPEVVVRKYTSGEYSLEVFDLDLSLQNSVALSENLSYMVAVPEFLLGQAHLVGARNVSGGVQLIGIDVMSGKVYWEGPQLVSGGDRPINFRNTTDGPRMIIGSDINTIIGR